ncbi:hypothetical protein QC763_101045 [Podospora pseudopauciseta]|uniref:Uncharacterized protein n=1 Tax=Podospora pseudopauciseta TaxID=2093780 RepID=A0ABR0HVS7_9PEZI|nr:hypothetical protein QC763_101045 [Podospora pseudopauciseta]
MPLNTAPILATTVYTGNWKREWEYEDLQQELKEVTKRNLDIHHYKNKPLSNSQDFLSEAGTALSQLAWDDTEHPSKSEPYHAEFLSHLAPQQLSTASGSSGYTCPRQNLKYGITIVPAGDESLLFMGYGDHADMPSEFRAEIHAKSKVVRKQVFDEEMKMCGSYVPRVGRGIEDFRLPPMDVLEKLFYAERVRQRRARYRELHGTRRSSDIGSQPSGDACAEHFLDEYSLTLYIHADETPSPPSAEIADGLRRLFTLQPQQEESGDTQGQELYHPDKLSELAQFLWQLADGNVRVNPGLDDAIWTKLRELLPSNSSEAEEDRPADDKKIKSFDGHRLDS